MSDPEFPANVSELPHPQDRDIARIKMQPHSQEAEQSVIGGLLLSSDGWDSVAGLGWVWFACRSTVTFPGG